MVEVNRRPHQWTRRIGRVHGIGRGSRVADRGPGAAVSAALASCGCSVDPGQHLGFQVGRRRVGNWRPTVLPSRLRARQPAWSATASVRWCAGAPECRVRRAAPSLCPGALPEFSNRLTTQPESFGADADQDQIVDPAGFAAPVGQVLAEGIVQPKRAAAYLRQIDRLRSRLWIISRCHDPRYRVVEQSRSGAVGLGRRPPDLRRCPSRPQEQADDDAREAAERHILDPDQSDRAGRPGPAARTRPIRPPKRRLGPRPTAWPRSRSRPRTCRSEVLPTARDRRPASIKIGADTMTPSGRCRARRAERWSRCSKQWSEAPTTCRDPPRIRAGRREAGRPGPPEPGRGPLAGCCGTTPSARTGDSESGVRWPISGWRPRRWFRDRATCPEQGRASASMDAATWRPTRSVE